MIFIIIGTSLHEKAQKLLKRRAYYYEKLDDFLNALSKFIRGENIGTVDLNDWEFLKFYGIHQSNGKAGERAAQMVKEIIGTRVK